MPSRSESFGLPVVEAMRAWTPCLVSDGGALPEVAGVSSASRVFRLAAGSDALLEDMLEIVRAGIDDALKRRSDVRAQYLRHYTEARLIEGTLEAYGRGLRRANLTGLKSVGTGNG